jgi:glyoxylase I family protein
VKTRPFNLVGLDHLVLRVANLDRSLNFYCEILGCTKERELPDLGLYQLRAGNQLIDIVPIGTKLGGTEPVVLKSRNQDHFCVLLDLFDEVAIRTYLEAQGVNCGAVGTRYGAGGYGDSVYVSDPDGNTVELKAAQNS